MTPQPGQAVVYVDVDFTAMRRALAVAAEDAARSLNTMAEAVRHMGKVFARAHEISVAGLEARMYVRAAMDPRYATEADLHGLVRLLLRRPHAAVGLGDSLFLHKEDRVRLAVAAMHGWAVHRA